MLEVGCDYTPFKSDKGLSPAETRAHFGSCATGPRTFLIWQPSQPTPSRAEPSLCGRWAIVSSPLTLSHDVNNKTIQDAVWDVIANKEVIGVNQAQSIAQHA